MDQIISPLIKATFPLPNSSINTTIANQPASKSMDNTSIIPGHKHNIVYTDQK
jgi:hypothetical protein